MLCVQYFALISTGITTNNLRTVDARTDMIASKQLSLFSHYFLCYANYMEDFRQTVLRCAIRELHDDGREEISTYLRIPLFLAWLSSWGPMNPNSHVGIFWDYENLPLISNDKVEEFEDAMKMVLEKNKISKSEEDLLIMAYGHILETEKLRSNITNHIKYQKTMRGKNSADAQIKKGMLAWVLATKWDMTKAKLVFKSNSEKKPWLILISADYGNKRVLHYSKGKKINIMIICEKLPQKLKTLPDLHVNWKELNQNKEYVGVRKHKAQEKGYMQTFINKLLK